MNVQKPRQIAARVLKDWLAGTGYAEDLLEAALAGPSLPPADRGLCQELVYGVVRWQAALDWLIARKTAGRPQKPWLRVLLQQGLYQMFWLDRIPDHAAVNETVELAKALGLGPQAGFVNAVLRGFAREQAETEKLLAELKLKEPALGHSHPAWLYQRWLARWGMEKARCLMEWNNQPPPTYARRNSLKTSPADLLARWDTEGVRFSTCERDWLAEGSVFRLDSHPPLAGLGSFQAGLFYVQDPSTLLAVRELAPQPGDTVLDMCAAPGGKTTLIAQLMQNRGLIVAQDNHAGRLDRVRENCARLGVTCVKLEVVDDRGKSIASSTEQPPDQFDRILIDAPCSNTGVMRRRVDLRWRIRPEEIGRLQTEQLALLRHAATLLKPGGALVYSTCSLEPEENEAVLEEFTRAESGLSATNCRELLPFTDEVDGAFVAKFRK